VDSSALAFEIAGRACFREAHRASRPKLLEPMMRLEVVTEARHLGDVIPTTNAVAAGPPTRARRATPRPCRANVSLAGVSGCIHFLQLPAFRQQRPRLVHDGVRGRPILTA
jgi:elongation factor G